MSTDESKLADKDRQDLATYESGDVPGYPLLIDLIAQDQAGIDRAQNSSAWYVRGKLVRRDLKRNRVPVGDHVLNWESRIIPSKSTAEAALQWLNVILRGGLETTEWFAREGMIPDDCGFIIRDAYRLLRAVAKEDYPDEI